MSFSGFVNHSVSEYGIEFVLNTPRDSNFSIIRLYFVIVFVPMAGDFDRARGILGGRGGCWYRSCIETIIILMKLYKRDWQWHNFLR